MGKFLIDFVHSEYGPIGLYIFILLTLCINAYLIKRFENAANKKFSSEMENIKSSLSLQININRFRYEKEFEILEEITTQLMKLKSAAHIIQMNVAFKDNMMFLNEYKREDILIEIIRYWEESEKVRDYLIAKAPFFPKNIYTQVWTIVANISKPVTIIETMEQNFTGKDLIDNSKQIESLIESVTDLIRQRIIEWDTITGYPL